MCRSLICVARTRALPMMPTIPGRLRARLEQTQGHADNHVIWYGPAPLFGDTVFTTEALLVMDLWLSRHRAGCHGHAGGRKGDRQQAGLCPRPVPFRVIPVRP
ncbi:DUF6351 family protein [Alcanivorax sp.]|uniref:DUF6351 family protein n=1 Tax=Alcanivorax sp. TaxID=1872427 RepID=UPI003BAB9753